MPKFMDGRGVFVVAGMCAVAIGTYAVIASQTQANQDLEAVRIWEATSEGEALCAKWKMPIGTPDHLGCMSDVKAVRANHDKRNHESY